MAAIVCGSCEMASITAPPVILMIEAMAAVRDPPMAPVANESDRHAAKKPAANTVQTPTAVDAVLRK